MKTIRFLRIHPAALGFATLMLAGCASKGYVREEVEASEARTGEQIDAVAGQMEQIEFRNRPCDVAAIQCKTGPEHSI